MNKKTIDKKVIFPKKLGPLIRISPSYYNYLKECKLRALLEYNKILPYLPRYPKTYLGDIAHNVLEKAVNGKLRNRNEAMIYWYQETKKIEDEMIMNPIEKHLVPIEKNINDFELKKMSIIKAVQNINNKKNLMAGHSQIKNCETEVWLENEDKTIVGRIDLIKTILNDIQIEDYKTGEILEKDSNEIKEKYKNQLKIYAALHFISRGKWPKKLILIDLNQNEYEVKFDIKECINILENAKLLRSKINTELLAGKNIDEFANPTQDYCKFCPYRPICKTYWNKKKEDNKEIKEILDFEGDVIKKVKLGNGLFRIELLVNGKTISIRGLSPERHEFLIKDAKKIKIYNLKKDITDNSYIDSLFTTSYIED